MTRAHRHLAARSGPSDRGATPQATYWWSLRAGLAGLALGCAALLAPAPALAQLSQQGGPIDITARETEFLDVERISRWIGDVDVRQGDARLLADRMDVYFAENARGGAGEIARIEAIGKVSYITPTETARSDRGVYYAESEQIEMCGNVTLVRGGNTLAGDCLIVEPQAGRSRLLSPQGARGRGAEGRVRAVFVPSDTDDS